MKRALITNDDGIASPGLWALARVARDAGYETVVAAPLEESSGSSAAITAVQSDGRIIVQERDIVELDGIPAYGVGALPGFIALIACRGAFGPEPDVVLSGINRGANTGHAVLHSGTVGAALTAVSSGRPALAASLHVGLGHLGGLHWETAAELAGRVLGMLAGLDRPVVLNLNVPNIPADQVRGLRLARLASFGAVQTNIAEVGEGYVQTSVSDIDAASEPGTDAALVHDGWATVTPLGPVCEFTGLRLPGLEDLHEVSRR